MSACVLLVSVAVTSNGESAFCVRMYVCMCLFSCIVFVFAFVFHVCSCVCMFVCMYE
jgi:hypothetical protein